MNMSQIAHSRQVRMVVMCNFEFLTTVHSTDILHMLSSGIAKHVCATQNTFPPLVIIIMTLVPHPAAPEHLVYSCVDLCGVEALECEILLTVNNTSCTPKQQVSLYQQRAHWTGIQKLVSIDPTSRERKVSYRIHAVQLAKQLSRDDGWDM
jgi:hypothetical protein